MRTDQKTSAIPQYRLVVMPSHLGEIEFAKNLNTFSFIKHFGKKTESIKTTSNDS